MKRVDLQTIIYAIGNVHTRTHLLSISTDEHTKENEINKLIPLSTSCVKIMTVF